MQILTSICIHTETASFEVSADRKEDAPDKVDPLEVMIDCAHASDQLQKIPIQVSSGNKHTKFKVIFYLYCGVSSTNVLKIV